LPTQAGSASAACAMPRRSKIDTIRTSDVFFTSAMNSFVSAGSAMRKACGSTMKPVVRQ
jgi:hypothetical protein